MTKGEIFLFDTCLIGPVALLLNQYFSYIIPELIVLVASLVNINFLLDTFSDNFFCIKRINQKNHFEIHKAEWSINPFINKAH